MVTPQSTKTSCDKNPACDKFGQFCLCGSLVWVSSRLQARCFRWGQHDGCQVGRSGRADGRIASSRRFPTGQYLESLLAQIHLETACPKDSANAESVAPWQPSRASCANTRSNFAYTCSTDASVG